MTDSYQEMVTYFWNNHKLSMNMSKDQKEVNQNEFMYIDWWYNKFWNIAKHQRGSKLEFDLFFHLRLIWTQAHWDS